MGTPRRAMFTISASSTAARPTVVAHGAKSNPVSSGYAAALVDACKSSGALEQVHADMETLDAYVKANASVAGFLANPTIVAEKKKDVLAKLGKEAGFHAFTGNFLNLLVDKRRENQIEAIIAEFETLFCEATDASLDGDFRGQARKRATIHDCEEVARDDGRQEHQAQAGSRRVSPRRLRRAILKDGSGFIDMSVR